MYKTLYLDEHIYNFLSIIKTPLAHVIFPQEIGRDRFRKVAYEKVCFSPLAMDEAQLCLKAFVKSVTMALEELHNNSWHTMMFDYQTFVLIVVLRQSSISILPQPNFSR